MSKTKKIIGFGAGLLALLIVAGVTLAFTQAPDQSEPAAANEPFQARQLRDEALAQALGISLEELQTARQEAFNIALEQMVAEGLISGDRAERMRARSAPRVWANRAYQDRGFHRGREIFDAALAEALNITGDQLEAARQEALTVTVEQAVEEGRLAAERADLILARAALARAVEPDDILALALGITPAELKAARDDGKTLRELVTELGLDPAAVRENIRSTRDQLIDQTLASGAITEEQAQLLREVSSRGQQRFRQGRPPGPLPIQPNSPLPFG